MEISITLEPKGEGFVHVRVTANGSIIFDREPHGKAITAVVADQDENEITVSVYQADHTKHSAVEITALTVNGGAICAPYLFDQPFVLPDGHTISTAYLGGPGTWSLRFGDPTAFYYDVMWWDEKQANDRQQHVTVADDGSVCETFSKFGTESAIDDSTIPSIDELYEMIRTQTT